MGHIFWVDNNLILSLKSMTELSNCRPREPKRNITSISIDTKWLILKYKLFLDSIEQTTHRSRKIKTWRYRYKKSFIKFKNIWNIWKHLENIFKFEIFFGYLLLFSMYNKVNIFHSTDKYYIETWKPSNRNTCVNILHPSKRAESWKAG